MVIAAGPTNLVGPQLLVAGLHGTLDCGIMCTSNGNEVRMSCTRPRQSIDPRLSRALQAVFCGPSPRLDVGDLARAAELSVAHFRRLFLEQLTTTPGRFLRAVRMERAHELVERTRRDLKEIALVSGCSSLSHFVTAFQRRYGAPPGAVRRAHDQSNRSY
jgi:transcriptional regulator GlxA family with amidase domain